MTNQVTDRSWNEAVVRQFPWISERFDVNSLTSRIKISKVSTELLEVIPSEEYGTDLSGYYTHDCVQFHDDDGVVIGEVNPKVNHSDADCMNQDRDGETIGDRWYHLEHPTAVRYLTRKTYYSGGSLSHDPDASDLEIFKVADFDVRWWMYQRDKASDGVVQSILADDASVQSLLLYVAQSLVEKGFTNAPKLSSPEEYSWGGVDKDGAILHVTSPNTHGDPTIRREYRVRVVDFERLDHLYAVCEDRVVNSIGRSDKTPYLVGGEIDGKLNPVMVGGYIVEGFQDAVKRAVEAGNTKHKDGTEFGPLICIGREGSFFGEPYAVVENGQARLIH